MAILPFGIPLSFLFVPARERFLKDLSGLSRADFLIFDLEDSLKDGEKDEGLKLLLSLDGSKRPEDQKWYARLNGDRLEKELSYLKGSCLQGYMLPKFEGTDVLIRTSAYMPGGVLCRRLRVDGNACPQGTRRRTHQRHRYGVFPFLFSCHFKNLF